ncbi:hypothetical protein TNCV_2063581 [Trichonephila clavipes]|nr:hypothetical protein TNCV_2063581 [Trichonephila clavipes]
MAFNETTRMERLPFDIKICLPMEEDFNGDGNFGISKTGKYSYVLVIEDTAGWARDSFCRSPDKYYPSQHGTEGEGNIPQSPALVISDHKTFGPTDLTSTYSVCTQRVFGGTGNEPRRFGLESDVLAIRLPTASEVECVIIQLLFTGPFSNLSCIIRVR